MQHPGRRIALSIRIRPSLYLIFGRYSSDSGASWITSFKKWKKPPSPQSPVDLSSVAIKPVAATSSYKEHFIPLTRRSVIREILQDEHLLTESEREKFEHFAWSLDAAIKNRYYGVLSELKELFDPLNPDTETQDQVRRNRRDRLDCEFWLLQRMSHVMDKANFRELTRQEVEYALRRHRVPEGIDVSVSPGVYDVLKIWALGKEQPPRPPSTILNRIRGMLNPILPSRFREKPIDEITTAYYKRVVLASRLKRDDRLSLKIFKDIPKDSLELIIPHGIIHMNQTDRRVFNIFLALGGLGAVCLGSGVYIGANSLALLSVVLTGTSSLVAAGVWSTYMHRRLSYLCHLNHTLYSKSLANNRTLLALLADRAEDETFKEALLVYAFLLASRSNQNDAGLSVLDANLPAGFETGMVAAQLETAIEEWLHRVSGPAVTQVEFNATDAIDVLVSLGLVHSQPQSGPNGGDMLYPLSLSAALSQLPGVPRGVLPLTRQIQSSQEEEIEGYELIGAGLPGHLVIRDVEKEDRERLKAVGWR